VLPAPPPAYRIAPPAPHPPRLTPLHQRPLQPPAALLETLTKLASTLEGLQRSLESYLESKRAAFPRFYFLSNDELLEILAQVGAGGAWEEWCWWQLVAAAAVQPAAAAGAGGRPGRAAQLSS
jgi:hypothetical protein